MEEALAESVARQRFTMSLLGIFAAVAVLLALGAQPAELMRRVLGRGLVLAAAGIVAGTAIAVAGSRILSGLLFGVSSTDAATYAFVGVSVLGVAAVASWLPARRVQRLSPVMALRQE